MKGAMICPQRLGKETCGFGNHRNKRDHSDHSIVKIGQNSLKSPGDVKKFPITKAPAKDEEKRKRRIDYSSQQWQYQQINIKTNRKTTILNI